MTEMTLSIIKPDAVKRNLTGKINTIFEENKLKIVAQRMILMSRVDAEKFYEVHKERAFFSDLCDYMTSGPVIVQVLHGQNAVIKNRELMGATNPENAEDGTIRKLYGISVEENSVHGSDSLENAKIEINFFFSSKEILSN
tara:strand:+ start:143 stop:565 length:423 start_codon:yes stop_codon:yes gene_type:complete